MIGASKKKMVLHQPKLDTIRMVEDFIREHSGEYKKRALWENLPKKMMYQTYCVIIDYLLESNKIVKASDSTLVWTWNPELVKYYLEHEELIVRK